MLEVDEALVDALTEWYTGNYFWEFGKGFCEGDDGAELGMADRGARGEGGVELGNESGIFGSYDNLIEDFGFDTRFCVDGQGIDTVYITLKSSTYETSEPRC